MYGFVNSALEKLIKRRFGVEKWDEIRTHANVLIGEADSFHVNHVYRDDDTYSVVAAASEVLGLDAATILEMFGEQFLLWCQESGYAKTLQLLGRSLQDFLTNLDALHDHLSIIYPQMEAPSFRCTEGLRKSEFLLHYYSERVGLENIVMGIVKSVAREYYNVEVEMKLLVKKGQQESDHSIFSIREVAFHSDNLLDGELEEESTDYMSDHVLVSSQTFCRAFPFHLIFDNEMNILQLGSSLSWVMPNYSFVKQKMDKSDRSRNLNHFFSLERPRMKLTFDNVLSHINTIFILKMVTGGGDAAAPPNGANGSRDRLSFSFAGSDPMRLRGQMIYLPESNSMLFLCSPRVKRLHDLEQRGLYLSDIPIHDATRGLLMMGQAAESEFINSVRLEELIMELKAVQKSLEEEKRRMSDLLREMLPVTVADSLMAGQMVEAERFESVTILFSDIVGFTSICSHSEPMQIVNMLNKLYSMFDQVVGQNKVYKVETIGDAYMVVGGLPERNSTHAVNVANQALDMMHYCKQVTRPDNKELITMRIGIHSGAVVAGIVGRRMPRYCLFGNTVNVASRTESNGMPGRIQVTEYTHDLLKGDPSFEFEYRGPLEFKNVPKPVLCFYLVDNKNREDFTPISIPDEQAYQFIVTRPSPPGSPYTCSPSLSPSPYRFLNQDERFAFCPDNSPSPLLPDIAVTHPTPSMSPCSSARSSVVDTPRNSTTEIPRILKSPSPPFSSDSESDRELMPTQGIMNFMLGDMPLKCPFSSSTPMRRPPDLELLPNPMEYRERMRAPSMSPVQEALHEDSPSVSTPVDARRTFGESTATTEIIAQVADKLLAETVDPENAMSVRKISDASNRSIEAESAGIVSDASKEDGADSDQNLRKISATSIDSQGSSVDGELVDLCRRGSVSIRVEYYDSLSRKGRRSGLSTVDGGAFILDTGSDRVAKTSTDLSPADINCVRVKKTSLDSQGSSGSTE